MKRILLSGVLGLAVTVGLTGGAMAEQIDRTIILEESKIGAFQMPDLNIGDEVTLRLVNPTNQPLQFHTDEAIGPQESWLVPANSERVIQFTYTQPFSDSVEYHVVDPQGNTVLQGTLLDLRESVADVGNVPEIPGQVAEETDELFDGEGNITQREAGQDVFTRTITLEPGMGEIVMDDLGVGDEVRLTLINPTNEALTFQTTEQLGTENAWTVPANGQRTVEFTYNRPFDDDVEFQVTSGTGAVISEGVLIEGGAPVQQQQTIRGYW